MEKTIQGIVGDVRHSLIISAWQTQQAFQFPGDPTQYVVVNYQYWLAEDGEHYEAGIGPVVTMWIGDRKTSHGD